MRSAKILIAAAAFTVGLASIGVKDAYGAPHKPKVKVEVEWEVKIEVKTGHGKPEVTGVETVDLVVPAALHGQKLRVPAKLYKPKWSKPVKQGPAMLILHGSGGLERMPKGDNDGPCSPKLEPQFARWGKRLAELGYVVLMPSSYAARGFCDMHVDTDRIPGTFDDRPEAVLGRLYDLDAASRFLCDQAEVDCDRLGVLGFSHGATMAMIALHWQIDHAIEYYREHSSNKVDFELPDLKPGRPEFQVGVAYYPGCGTDGVLPLSTSDKASIYNKYFPTADLFVLHGSGDPLVELCSVEHGSGPREEQSAQVADYLGTSDTFHVKVYDNAEHGFDNAGCSDCDEKANSSRDKVARDAALKIALKQISTHLN